jgi:hypothetical protein
VLTAVVAALAAGDGDLQSILEALKQSVEAAIGFVLPMCSDFQ